MKSSKILITYSFFICLVLTVVGVLSAKNVTDLLSSFIYLPLIFYFGTKILHFYKKPIHKPTIKKSNALQTIPKTNQNPVELEVVPGVADNDKRLFLKLIGSSGMALLFMALFTKKAQASFFGSAPLGPGVVAIKNVEGNTINPAEKNPTDGYEITEIDDSTSPAYYGFVSKTGAWYIMQEDATGAYRYHKGDSGFSTAWIGKALLSYGYFNTVFG